MSEQLRVDPHALRAAAPAFDSLAAASDDALRALLGALDGEGRCWGQDDTGAAFAASYLPAVDELSAAWSGLTRVVGEVGAAVATVAANVDATDGRAQLRLGGGGAP